ncbi:MAG TPA: DUF1289 domain-containing protein [Rhodocyclaceae bacterium]|nr:DUF1289 domain-containing protein [Rhodocyclaceae bacterium]HMV53947.1 DUF1289 domain-containing protein [Rhodocyclaceae bacterium]HMZ84472.1 DUF1289 domain-containing protein [Rhodocyclaceae bacterium]HNA04028.1 DUF1289 domain-containing protein [Rhodocyclaceae bacterium]HNB79659.1 DUF1289 domain-containing protein [Rhodocyclaceae bacterium]
MNPLPQKAVASPCIGVCRMSAASGLCEGCQRTLDEIAAWGQSSDVQKLAILARVAERRAGAAATACGSRD